MAASLGIALAGVAWARRRSRQEETAQIEARYHPDLIGVRTSPDDGKRSVVDVVGISALAKVAKAYGSLILDHHEGGAHSYYVDAGTMLYRYRPGLAVAHQLQLQYAPGHHRGGSSPVTSRLSQRALRTPFRGLSPSPWTFRSLPQPATRRRRRLALRPAIKEQWCTSPSELMPPGDPRPRAYDLVRSRGEGPARRRDNDDND